MTGTELRCRLSGEPLTRIFCDLGVSPLANSYVGPGDALAMEPFYPLTAYVAERSLLVQLPAVVSRDQVFRDYAYFSSYSDSWLSHARAYAEAMIARFSLGRDSLVVEVASNDGYLLRWFVERGIPVRGVEPAANVAVEAEHHRVPTVVDFFGRSTAATLAARGEQADLVIANNVLAHVPDLHDFVAGFPLVLKPSGVLTIEFPHLLRLITENQFDTIYHEHFSYFSLLTAERSLGAHGLQVFDVEEVPTHGGSLRIYASRIDGVPRPIGERVRTLREKERSAGMHVIDGYLGFHERVVRTKRALLTFLIAARDEGKRVVAYGAAAKGNTLLNYCGIRSDLVDYAVDRSPHKQGRLLPGSRLPIHTPEKIFETMPDYVLILAWNLREEITGQMAGIRSWGGRFVVPIPHVQVLP